MPEKASNDILFRQWWLLKLITQHPPGDTVAELHKKLEEIKIKVSRRTVERDLNSLSVLFPIMNDEETRPTLWRWMDGAFFDMPKMEIADAVSLTVVEDVLKPLLPVSFLKYLEPRFKHARDTLKEKASGNARASWVDKVRYVQPAQPLKPPQIIEYVLEVVQTALMEDRQLSVTYLPSGSDDYKEYILHPLGIFQRGQITYLAATAFDYDDVRRYALHRMAHAEDLEKKARKPRDFDLDEFIRKGFADFGDGKQIKLELKVSPELARALDETPLSDDQKICSTEGEDWDEVTATVAMTQQIHWWISNWGAHVVVVGPRKLRDAIIKEVLLVCESYK